MAQTSTPKTFVSRSAPQAHPIFLIKPIQYPTPNNPRLNQPATIIRPILSSNINVPIVRPPLVRRLLRPTIIRPLPPRIVTNENLTKKNDPILIQRTTPIRESSIESSSSSISTLSTISSNHEEIVKKKSCCYYLPCYRKTTEKSEKIINHPINNNYFNLKLNTRTIYIIIAILFIFFLIVIILLIVLIAVRS